MLEEEIHESTDRALQVYGRPLDIVTLFNDMVQEIKEGYND